MNAKEVHAYISAGLKSVAILRQATGKPPEPPPEARVIRVREIATALDNLRFIRDAKDNYEAFEKSMATLLDAVCDERWYLVKEAADLLQTECYLPRLCREKLVEDGKFIAYSLAQIDDPKLGKSEILDIIKEVYPEVAAHLPASTEDLTRWWKEIGNVPRANGVGGRKHEDAKKALTTRLVESKKAHFPEFMGPRHDPHWEGKGRFDT